VVNDLHSVLNGAVKIVGVSDDAQLIARAESELRHRVGPFASASSSQPYYIDFTHRDANKGMVVRTAANYFSISTSQIAVIGDGLNDVLMFANALEHRHGQRGSPWLDDFLYLPEVRYVIILVWLIFSGPGRYSIDGWFLSSSRREKTK
jgi:hypothetical protein